MLVFIFIKSYYLISSYIMSCQNMWDHSSPQFPVFFALSNSCLLLPHFIFMVFVLQTSSVRLLGVSYFFTCFQYVLEIWNSPNLSFFVSQNVNYFLFSLKLHHYSHALFMVFSSFFSKTTSLLLKVSFFSSIYCHVGD